MSMQLIPSHWVVRRSTPFFTRENVPQALLTLEALPRNVTNKVMRSEVRDMALATLEKEA